MAKLKVVKIGDDTLRQISRPVECITPRIKTLVADMIETMHVENGCGLAAPQVGVLRRIAVVEVEPGSPIVLINPKIIARAGEQEGPEGCLSVPGKTGTVKRPMHVTVRATDINGKQFEISGSELKARAFCHEIDHLDGKLYVDIASEVHNNDKE